MLREHHKTFKMSLPNILQRASNIKTPCAGFTLIELLIAVSIVGIISAIAVPVLQNLLPIYHLNSAAGALVSDLQYAKMKAVSQKRNIKVLFNIENNSYKMQYKDHGAWNDLAGESERSLSNSGVSLIAANNDPVFTAKGLVSPTATAQIRNSNGTREIKISLCGRIKVIR